MSEITIFDTSVLVSEIRTGVFRDKIDSVSGLIRMSSVVLAELRRGAVDSCERDFLRALERNRPILTPTEKNWFESGEVLAEIRSKQGMAAAKLRDLHFDVLIALTARSHGARLITSNRRDFELIHKHRQFKLEVW
jgi:predicted nucleic acid-binding protein